MWLVFFFHFFVVDGVICCKLLAGGRGAALGQKVFPNPLAPLGNRDADTSRRQLQMRQAGGKPRVNRPFADIESLAEGRFVSCGELVAPRRVGGLNLVQGHAGKLLRTNLHASGYVLHCSA